MRRRAPADAKTPDKLREAAKAARLAANDQAREALEQGLQEADHLEEQADQLELEQRIVAKRGEIAEAAAADAKASLEARAAGDEAAAEADRHASRRAALQAELEERESFRRRRRDEIERATADGDVDQALALERSLDEVDTAPLRDELARSLAAEQAANDRAAQAYAVAEQHSAEAADHRASLEAVADRLRPEYERRRAGRNAATSYDLFAFSRRGNLLETTLRVAAEHESPKPAKPIDSADVIDNPLRIRVDPETGRVAGVDLPIQYVP